MPKNVKDTSKTLQEIEEDQGNFDFNMIVAEVFEDIRKSPERYFNTARYDFNVTVPRGENNKEHTGTYIIDNNRSVLILGPADPENPFDLVRYFFSKKRRAVKMISPVSVEFNEAQTKTYEELLDKLTDWNEKRILKEKVERFRENRVRAKEDSSTSGHITFNRGSNPNANLTYNGTTFVNANNSPLKVSGSGFIDISSDS